MFVDIGGLSVLPSLHHHQIIIKNEIVASYLIVVHINLYNLRIVLTCKACIVVQGVHIVCVLFSHTCMISNVTENPIK